MLAGRVGSAGFTLVELVMVIILIGVLSALGIGLFARSSAFSPLLVTQQLASATLLAQQAALAGNPTDNVTIAQNGDSFDFTAGGTVFSIRRENATLAYRLANQTGAFTPVSGAGLVVRFDGMGRVAAPAARQTVEFRIAGDSTFYLCMSSLGAVFQGRCNGA